MKTIFLNLTDENGISFSVEDDSKLLDDSDLKVVQKDFLLRCEKYPVAVFKVKNVKRRMICLGPWYLCHGCYGKFLEYEARPFVGLNKKTFCKACARKVETVQFLGCNL